MTRSSRGAHRDGYFVTPNDWPAGAPAEPVSLKDIYDVWLGITQEQYNEAMDGLAHTTDPLPQPESKAS